MHDKIAIQKTMSFALLHMAVAFTVGAALTGSLMVGGALALIEPAINMVAYFLHEKVWLARKQKLPGLENLV